ncbi:YbaB/EbfC family nucleoid-associated protein [Actinomadura graeca]|uniref:YbaB/EbfC family nucleoid-associated protein n=1 Tax=Actinomadura graeca TaxID=2750812 RepID=A0ABX8QSK2_9ACTN|nr:YbaB/EbfC family nucleoid-associated protein [Actinomadura graeca]QXJ21169.1 YbaB/EbfC family nucleoid-associated protein [Actinomadura graeca]
MDEQISRAYLRLADLRAEADGGGPPAGTAAVRAVATSEDERIRVTAVNRRIEGIDMDARLLRLEAADLAARLVTAVNAALEQARPLPPEGDDVPPVDVESIRQGLDDVFSEGMIGIQRVTNSLGEAVAQINRRATMHGSFEPPDLEALFERTRAVMASARKERADEQAEASAAGGRVQVAAAWDGRIVRLVLDPALGLVGVTDGVRAAANEALAEAESRARRAARPSAEFTDGARAVQESGVALLRDYAAALQNLMNSAQPK